MNNLIIAIDPGPEESACVIYNASGGETDKTGRILGSNVLPSLDLLRNIRAGLYRVFPAVLAIEGVACFGMPVGQEVFDTCVWIGRFIQAWEDQGQPWYLIYRKRSSNPFPAIAMHLCKSNRAKDANIRQALIDRFGPGKEAAIGTKKRPGPLYGISGHLWSALAVAVTCADFLPVAKDTMARVEQ